MYQKINYTYHKSKTLNEKKKTNILRKKIIETA
jgi:hypothetical protein